MIKHRSVTLLTKAGGAESGISRYARALGNELAAIGWQVRSRRTDSPWPSSLVAATRSVGIDPAAFWSSYPLVPPRSKGNVLHLTSQTLAASMALIRSPDPVIVTVHDILPLLLQDHPELSTLRHPVDRLFYHLAVKSLFRADVLIADSQFTAETLVKLVSIPDGRIEVVPLGVDLTRFSPLQPDDARVAAAREAYGLSENARIILYVGGEDPRKNLVALLEAMPRVIAREPGVVLLKVGPEEFGLKNSRLAQMVEKLGLSQHVRFLGTVSDDMLRALYVLATVCVVPSLYEGFGLPVLEAMACGSPVVCSNSSSLSEVAGDAAVLVAPRTDAIAAGILSVLLNEDVRERLRRDGPLRAGEFTWRRTAEKTAGVYERAMIARRNG